jgi:hypothetical protein
MLRYLLAVLFTFSASTAETADIAKLEVFVGGGIAGSGPNFFVRLDREGHLKVTRTGLPVVRPAKFTETSTSVRIKPSEARKIFRLAEAARDFASGCKAVSDGTSARLSLTTAGGVLERKCTSASTWPNGAATKMFLHELNANLPEKFQIY